jgi:hypothetical protein
LRHELQHVWIDERRVRDFKDEAPSAYRDLRQVLRAQQDLCQVERTLKPVLNYKR